jgi:hypothetical protein
LLSVDIKCICKGGCNKCNWEVVSEQNILGVDDHFPIISHLNGFLHDYTYAPAAKHKWDVAWPDIKSKAVKYYEDDEFDMNDLDEDTKKHLTNARENDDFYLCISGQNKMKKQFGYAFYSQYHKVLYKPGEDNKWYNWNKFMCRYGLRYSEGAYEYFSEDDFHFLQVEDRSSLGWVDANDFIAGDYDTDQIVTAADNDDADGDENDETEVTYDGENANWRINGACRIIARCTRGMVRQFDNGNSQIPCRRENQIYRVRAGSLRMYKPGIYYDLDTNTTATVPKFCCKESQYLHWAEPLLWSATDVFGQDGTRFIQSYSEDQTRSLSPLQELLVQLPVQLPVYTLTQISASKWKRNERNSRNSGRPDRRSQEKLQ